MHAPGSGRGPSSGSTGTIRPMAGALARYVAAFVDVIERDLGGLSARGDHRREAVIEASNLVSALVEADGRLTDAELRAWLADIGPLLDPPVFVTPTRLREGDLLRGRTEWLTRASTMFDLLVRADARDGQRRSHRYYER